MSRGKETLIGAAVLAVMVVVFALKAADRGIERDGTGYPLTAVFHQAEGLGIGSQVRLAGIPVGSVADQRIDAQFRVRVTLHIDWAVQIPRDTSAVIETDGLLGGKYIELQPGGSEEMLASGDSIEFTQDAVLIEDLLARVVSQAKAKLSAATNSGTSPDSGPDSGPDFGPDTGPDAGGKAPAADGPSQAPFPSLRDLLEEENQRDGQDGEAAPEKSGGSSFEETRSYPPPGPAGRT